LNQQYLEKLLIVMCINQSFYQVWIFYYLTDFGQNFQMSGSFGKGGYKKEDKVDWLFVDRLEIDALFGYAYKKEDFIDIFQPGMWDGTTTAYTGTALTFTFYDFSQC
jgi:hypothetical protein